MSNISSLTTSAFENKYGDKMSVNNYEVNKENIKEFLQSIDCCNELITGAGDCIILNGRLLKYENGRYRRVSPQPTLDMEAIRNRTDVTIEYGVFELTEDGIRNIMDNPTIFIVYQGKMITISELPDDLKSQIGCETDVSKIQKLVDWYVKKAQL